MAAPARCRDNQPEQPRATLDDHYLGQLPGIRLPAGIKGAQARHENVHIAAPVRVMRPDKLSALAPDFAGLSLVHLHNDGHLRRTLGNPGSRFRLAARGRHRQSLCVPRISFAAVTSRVALPAARP